MDRRSRRKEPFWTSFAQEKAAFRAPINPQHPELAIDELLGTLSSLIAHWREGRSVTDDALMPLGSRADVRDVDRRLKTLKERALYDFIRKW